MKYMKFLTDTLRLNAHYLKLHHLVVWSKQGIGDCQSAAKIRHSVRVMTVNIQKCAMYDYC